jgi:hypothetical protein
MRKRFFADGVDSCRHGFPIVKREEYATLVLPDEAEAASAVAYEATPGTQAAFHFLFRLFLIKHGFVKRHATNTYSSNNQSCLKTI